jgi:GNAT superfamily N-acetyltransferase
MIEIRPVDAGFDRWEDLLAMILASFAYMSGRIDPPSSALRLTPLSLAEKATQEIGFVAVENGALAGCIFCRPEADLLYIGKLAISPQHQGKGLGRRLLAVAEQIAADRSLQSLMLETRIELTDNHVTFARWGFERTAERSHPGFARPTYIEMRKALAS